MWILGMAKWSWRKTVLWRDGLEDGRHGRMWRVGRAGSKRRQKGESNYACPPRNLPRTLKSSYGAALLALQHKRQAIRCRHVRRLIRESSAGADPSNGRRS